MIDDGFAGFDLKTDGFHDAETVGMTITRDKVINMFGEKAVRAVIGVASASDWGAAVVTDEVLFELDEVLRHANILP